MDCEGAVQDGDRNMLSQMSDLGVGACRIIFKEKKKVVVQEWSVM